MMLLPFTTSILEALEDVNREAQERKDLERYQIGVLLAICYGCNIGGMATTVGTAANLILVSTMEAYFGAEHAPNFATFAALGVPVTIAMCVTCIVILYLKWGRNLRINIPQDLFTNQVAKLPPMDRDEIVVSVITLLQLILWCSRDATFPGTHGWSEIWGGHAAYWDDGAVALLCSFPLFLIPSKQRPGDRMVNETMLREGMPWDVILLIGAGFAIAEVVESSGTAEFMGDSLGNLATSVPFFPFLMILCGMVTTLTEIASNTATAAIILPVLIPAAVEANMTPLSLSVPAVLACSTSFCLPMATAPNSIVFSSGRMSMLDMFSTGIWLNLAAFTVLPLTLCLVSFQIFDLGGVTGAAPAPTWAVDALPDDGA